MKDTYFLLPMSSNLYIGVTTVVRLLGKRFTSWVALEESKFGSMTFIVLIQVFLYFETIRRSHSCSKTSFEGFRYTSSIIVGNFICGWDCFQVPTQNGARWLVTERSCPPGMWEGIVRFLMSGMFWRENVWVDLNENKSELNIFVGKCRKTIRPGILVFLFIKTTYLKVREMNVYQMWTWSETNKLKNGNIINIWSP